MNEHQLNAIASFEAAKAQVKGINTKGRAQRYDIAIALTKAIPGFIFTPVFHRCDRDLKGRTKHQDILTKFDWTSHDVRDGIKWAPDNSLDEAAYVSFGYLATGATCYVSDQGELVKMDGTVSATDLFTGPRLTEKGTPCAPGLSSHSSRLLTQLQGFKKLKDLSARHQVMLDQMEALILAGGYTTTWVAGFNATRADYAKTPGFANVNRDFLKGLALRSWTTGICDSWTISKDKPTLSISFDPHPDFDGYFDEDGKVVMN